MPEVIKFHTGYKNAVACVSVAGFLRIFFILAEFLQGVWIAELRFREIPQKIDILRVLHGCNEKATMGVARSCVAVAYDVKVHDCVY